jgi:prophage regulatory protein
LKGDTMTASTPTRGHEPQFVRLPDVIGRVNLQRPTIYKLVRAGAFPQPVKVGSASLWVRAEIDDWAQARIAERDARRDAQEPSR